MTLIQSGSLRGFRFNAMTNSNKAMVVGASTRRPLTTRETERLERCEARIRQSIIDMKAAWKEFGRALGVIHRYELWRGKADSLGEYCEGMWNIPQATAYEWMTAAGVLIAFEKTKVVINGEFKIIEPPAKIQHAKALAALPFNMRPQAMQDARARAECEGRQVTTYDVKREVAAILHEPEPATNGYMQHKREQAAFKRQIVALWDKLDDKNACEVVLILQKNWERRLKKN
jgi:hypothetical protein